METGKSYKVIVEKINSLDTGNEVGKETKGHSRAISKDYKSNDALATIRKWWGVQAPDFYSQFSSSVR